MDEITFTIWSKQEPYNNLEKVHVFLKLLFGRMFSNSSVKVITISSP